MPTQILTEAKSSVVDEAKTTELVESAVALKIDEEFPDRTKVVEAQKAEELRLWHEANIKREKECMAAGGYIWELQCVNLPQHRQAYPTPTNVRSTASVSVRTQTASGLIGSIGWARAGGNCVNTAKAHGKNQPGNPSSWYATTRTPFIGAAAIHYGNHVSIVVGIWSDGSVEVVHENYWGGRHRFSPSEIRGYF